MSDKFNPLMPGGYIKITQRSHKDHTKITTCVAFLLPPGIKGLTSSILNVKFFTGLHQLTFILIKSDREFAQDPANNYFG